MILLDQASSPNPGQYRSTILLQELSKLGNDDNRIRLGIAAEDLFVPDLNFVFGEASSVDRVIVFSIARLDPQKYGEPPKSKNVRKSKKKGQSTN